MSARAAQHLPNFETLPAWKQRLLRCTTQSPLLKTRASLQGIHALRARPSAIMLGIGLSSPSSLSAGLPFDTLSMLLAAEQMRRAIGGHRLVILVADRHALTNGFSGQQVESCARNVEQQLSTVCVAFGLPVQIVRGSVLHHTSTHRAIVERIEQRAGSAHAYVKLEIADTECIRRANRGIVKLGWALDQRPEARDDTRDERHFDARYREWLGGDMGFAYVRAGRTLDPRRPVAAPYLAHEARHRILLSPHEPCRDKLVGFLARASRAARNDVLAYLRRITCVYDREIAPLEGDVPQRVCKVLQHIYGATPPLRKLA